MTPSAGLEKWFQRWRGLGLGGPRGKGFPSVSKGPKPPIKLLQLLKNSPREVKRAHFRYILGPPWSHPGNGIYGARRGRSLPVPPPPGFSGHVGLLSSIGSGFWIFFNFHVKPFVTWPWPDRHLLKMVGDFRSNVIRSGVADWCTPHFFAIDPEPTGGPERELARHLNLTVGIFALNFMLLAIDS